jgi:hypothetical protein
MKISIKQLLTPSTLGSIILLNAADYLFRQNEKLNEEAVRVLDSIRKDIVVFN